MILLGEHKEKQSGRTFFRSIILPTGIVLDSVKWNFSSDQFKCVFKCSQNTEIARQINSSAYSSNNMTLVCDTKDNFGDESYDKGCG